MAMRRGIAKGLGGSNTKPGLDSSTSTLIQGIQPSYNEYDPHFLIHFLEKTILN